MGQHHKLLERQIKRKLKNGETIPDSFLELFDAISSSYEHFENDRRLLERAMTISSNELRENYEQLAVQAELKRSNAELQSFVSTASHDLKAPLRTIGSFAQLLGSKQDLKANPENKEFLNFIIQGVKRMSNLIDDMRDYAKLGNQKELQEIIDPSLILDQVLQNLNYAIVESQANVIIKNKIPKFTTFPSFVSQIFQNLIGNSIKYRSERPLEITIDCYTEGEKTIVSIKDNGKGIPDAEKDKAFKAFVRLSSSKNTDGSGLGLSICKKIVDGWAGEIWLETKVNEGTTFFFTIPNEEVIPQASQQQTETLVSEA